MIGAILTKLPVTNQTFYQHAHLPAKCMFDLWTPQAQVSLTVPFIVLFAIWANNVLVCTRGESN